MGLLRKSNKKQNWKSPKPVFTGLNQANERAAIDKKLRTSWNLGSGASCCCWAGRAEKEGARVADGILKCFSSPPSSHLRGGWGENFKIVGFMREGEGVKWVIMLRGWRKQTSIVTEWISSICSTWYLKHTVVTALLMKINKRYFYQQRALNF